MPLQGLSKEKPRRFWGHSQNLNDKPGGRQGWKIRHGRAWFYFWDNTLGWEWNFGQRNCSVGVTFHPDGDDDTIDFDIAIPLLFAFYLNIDYRRLRRNKLWNWLLSKGHGERYSSRGISIRIFDWALWLEFWAPQMSWHSKEPFWMRWTFRPSRFFLGRWEHSKREIRKVDVQVPMPEKTYDATVTVIERTRKRKRWPFKRRTISSTIDIPGGIPHPGKGTCAYNCGEDALISCSVEGDNVHEAIGNAVSSVLKRRKDYPL